LGLTSYLPDAPLGKANGYPKPVSPQRLVVFEGPSAGPCKANARSHGKIKKSVSNRVLSVFQYAAGKSHTAKPAPTENFKKILKSFLVIQTGPLYLCSPKSKSDGSVA
jgi:hypothetical protein